MKMDKQTNSKQVVNLDGTFYILMHYKGPEYCRPAFNFRSRFYLVREHFFKFIYSVLVPTIILVLVLLLVDKRLIVFIHVLGFIVQNSTSFMLKIDGLAGCVELDRAWTAA